MTEYLYTVGVVALWVWVLFNWVVVVSGAFSWRNHNFDRFETVLWWVMLALGVASTAWLLVLV